MPKPKFTIQTARLRSSDNLLLVCLLAPDDTEFDLEVDFLEATASATAWYDETGRRQDMANVDGGMKLAAEMWASSLDDVYRSLRDEAA